MPELGIVEQSPADLQAYATVSMTFEVRRIFDVRAVDGGLGGLVLTERGVETPWVKDYDAFPAAEQPTGWAERWDISRWGIFSAFVDGVRASGCVVAWDTPGIDTPGERRDLAVLWDIRVHPDRRRRGIGARLFRRAAAWARSRGCRLLKVETQNINVPACRFYAAQGCVLGAINRHAYAECPDEVELVWYLDLQAQ